MASYGDGGCAPHGAVRLWWRGELERLGGSLKALFDLLAPDAIKASFDTFFGYDPSGSVFVKGLAFVNKRSTRRARTSISSRDRLQRSNQAKAHTGN
jgi:hypothetical protein